MEVRLTTGMKGRLEVRIWPHLCQHSYKTLWVTNLKFILYNDPIFQKTSSRDLKITSPTSDIQLSWISWNCSCVQVTNYLMSEFNFACFHVNLCALNLLYVQVLQSKPQFTGKRTLIYFIIYRALPYFLVLCGTEN